ncbi:hypothetical protein AJ78_06042 [Emergomyces pasteurianus Ep9510]|uniref:Protein kinase domain-containing protein n=1 Tax=Emergomyces pasteurianus Ep9510 TaxID=1447872 RepID=A0A1J9QBG8_9EURO|nr:hypothetical protein AJ78_06042 [Emergomyces pasteurianus Ep9510]
MTTRRGCKIFVDGLNAIHGALVEHSDVHPRNKMIVEGDPERTIWIDFDRAQSFSQELTERQNEWIEFENELMAELAECMEYDFTQGKTDKTLQYSR